MKKIKLYLDDERSPKSTGWDIVRDFDQFRMWIDIYGLPDIVSFDHDLGINKDGSLKKSGVDCARWLCNYCIDNGLPLPEYNIHTANGVGYDNIESIFKTFNKIFKEKNKLDI